jgi:hypothetical protein
MARWSLSPRPQKSGAIMNATLTIGHEQSTQVLDEAVAPEHDVFRSSSRRSARTSVEAGVDAFAARLPVVGWPYGT